jgi:hypothetical protein
VDRNRQARIEKETSVRITSTRALAAGGIVLLLLVAGGATALASSGSGSPGGSPGGAGPERVFTTADCGGKVGPPGPLGDMVSAAATYLGLSPDQIGQELKSGKSLADVANERGKSVAGLEQAVIGAAKTALDQRVAAGEITATEEQHVLDQLNAQLDDFVNGRGGLSISLGGAGIAVRVGGPGIAVRVSRPDGAVALKGPYETAADYLGLSADQLMRELQAGKSLADIAAEQGKSVDGLKQALIQALTADIQQTVDGLVSQKGLGGPACDRGVAMVAGAASAGFRLVLPRMP